MSATGDDDTRPFQHLAPPLRLFSGSGSLNHLGRELERSGSLRAAVFCGGSLGRQPALLDLVRSAMGERFVGVFTGVKAHSPKAAVLSAVEALRDMRADAVVAVGGGSAIVTARAASILLAEGGELDTLSTSRDADGILRSPKLLAPKAPQFIIPTTPTTAVVKAGSAVFDPERQERRALFDPKTRVQSVFLHPAFTQSAPRALVLSASFNTLAMAIEGLSSRMRDPLADAFLMHAVRLVDRSLTRLGGAEDGAVRTDLVLAAIMCGQGTDHAGAGLTTVLGHAIGARHGVENGLANAILLPRVIRFNAQAAAIGLGRVADALSLRTADAQDPAPDVAGHLEMLAGQLALPGRLRDVGVPRDALPGLAEVALQDWFLRGNPRPVSAAELKQFLDQAW